jgi:glucose-6-phosphate isomerase
MFAQKKATEIVFKKKNIPFRSFEIKKRDEKTLGELFCFFILETILIGKALKINPFDQPAVELIKKKLKNFNLRIRSKYNFGNSIFFFIN